MSALPAESRVLINFYLRKGWFDHVQRVCEALLDKKGRDATVLFWRAVGIALERSFSSAIRELESLRKGRELELPCLHALIYAHGQCQHVDHDEIAQLEMQVCMAEESAPDASRLVCATLFWHLNEHAKARKMLEQLTSTRRTGTGSSPPDPALLQRALVLRGWVDLTTEAKTKREAELRDHANQFFDQAQEYGGWLLFEVVAAETHTVADSTVARMRSCCSAWPSTTTRRRRSTRRCSASTSSS